MYTLNRDRTIEAFRLSTLASLDVTAKTAFPHIPADWIKEAGASDADLPKLFAAIDAHVEKLAERYGVALVEYVGASDAEVEAAKAVRS